MSIRSLFIYSVLILCVYNSYTQAQSITWQEKYLKLARISINENRCHDALRYLDSLQQATLTREGELEAITLVAKSYGILALEPSCSETDNFGVCSEYVTETINNYNLILQKTDIGEIFNQFTKAELDRFYDNLITAGANQFITQNFQGAAFYFDQALLVNSDDPINCRYGMIANELCNNYDKALEYSNMLLDLNYDSINVYESRSLYYEQLKAPQKAIEEVENGLAKHPVNYKLTYRGIGICVRNKWFNKAIDLIDPILKKYPFDERTLMTAGMLSEAVQDHKKAIFYYVRAANISPTRFDAYMSLSQVQFNEAIKLQKILMNWNNNKKKPEYKNVHKSDLRKESKFYLELTVKNASEASRLNKEDKESLTTKYNALLLLNRTKELKDVEETLDKM
ncbi:hypothetical protein [Flammeovirga sp. SubArs3]|uniref:tetratricopeptide repeat protein n=1 Tax=Flammeovirga sp. SubArs3 TaxID=2995316 RepID=UPI00248B476C|nr:hypothetical protein [Flammeovirga sp. SubArs3]